MPAKSKGLIEKIIENIAVAQSGLWIRTYESNHVLNDMLGAIEAHPGEAIKQWRVWEWSPIAGLVCRNSDGAQGSQKPLMTTVRDMVAQATSESMERRLRHILVVSQGHLHVAQSQVPNIHALEEFLDVGDTLKLHFVVMAPPTAKVSEELRGRFTVLDDQPPPSDQILAMLNRKLQDEVLAKSDAKAMFEVGQALSGLRMNQALLAAKLSTRQFGKLDVPFLWQTKLDYIKADGLVQMYLPKEGFDTMGGMDNYKDLIRRCFSSPRAKTKPPRGMLHLGPPGTGKSEVPKRLAHELGRPLVVLNFGALKNSLVGESEGRLRSALKLAEVVAPCVILMDEIEKDIAGAGTDTSGVSTSMLGTVLSWMSDRTADCYAVATCNNAHNLPPELTRSGRFDAMMMFDIPDASKKRTIWDIYIKSEELTEEQAASRPDDFDWVPADIKSCVEKAALLNCTLEEAAQYISPVCKLYPDAISNVRKFAHDRAISADYPGRYNMNRIDVGELGTPAKSTRKAKLAME